MGQQSCLLESDTRRLGQIRQSRFMPQAGKFLPRCAVAQFRLVAEGEQGFLAAGSGAGPRDGEHLRQRQIGCAPFARRLGESAVVACIPAQLGQRNKHLARIGQDCAVRRVAPRRRGAHQRFEFKAGKRQGFVPRQPPIRRYDQTSVAAHGHFILSFVAPLAWLRCTFSSVAVTGSRSIIPFALRQA